MDYLSSVSGWTYVYTILCLTLAYTLTTILHNLYLPPLSRYPGPFLNRATSLRHAWSLARGNSAQYTHLLHEKYGPVVRLGPNHLSYVDPRAWRDIYGHQQHHSSSINGQQNEHTKSPTYYRALLPGAATNILDAPSREEHARLRKALAHGFSERALRAQEGRIREFVDLLMSKLATKIKAEGKGHRGEGGKGAVVDLVKWYTWTTFDLTSELVFALPFGCLEREEDHLFVKLNNEGLAPSGVLGGMYYAGLGWVADVLASGVQRLMGEFSAEMGRLLGNRLSEEGGKEDLFEGLVRRREELNLGMRELESNAMVLVIAGSDTTATQLSGVTYLLLSNPEALGEVKREVRLAYKSASEITLATINRLPYLVACMSEALRCYPPVVSGMVREVAKPGATIAGKYVAPGTMVEIQHWSMNHSSLHWKDPWAFRPERFLHGSAAESGMKQTTKDNMDAFNPFSTGPRNCIGRNLSYAEMRLIFARLIYQFDLSLADTSKDWMKNQRAFTFWEKPPLNVRLTPAAGYKP